jgi:HAE1 family hydrophobic/amphiphilic exporter-1
MDNKRGVILAIQRQPGTNTVEVVDNIRRCCRSSARRFRPRSSLGGLRRVAIHPRLDSRRGVHAAAHHRIVVLVIFLFLRNSPPR